MYRTGIEHLLGFKKAFNTLSFDPCIPDKWKGFEINYRFGSTIYNIKVYNPEGISRGSVTVKIDGDFV
jgi:cyclic beta-1,2-glucan synthetase